MGKGYKSEKDIKKALNKVKSERREQRIKAQKELAEMPRQEKLELEISEIKSRIKLIEADLNGQFKGNKLIENKLKMLQEDLNQKEKEKENGEKQDVSI